MLVHSFYLPSLEGGEGKWVLFILRKVELVGFFVFFLRGEARWRVVGQFLEKGSGFLEIATMYFTARAFMICLCTN